MLHLHPKSAEGYLKFLDYICGVCGVVNFGYFVSLFVSGWRQSGFSMSVILILLIGVIYQLSRLSVKQELEIGKSLFPSGCFPDELKLKDRITITLQVILFMALYMFLGWAASRIMLASLCMFAIGCIDFNTRKQINEKMRQYFSDAKYSLSPNERGYNAIQYRRSVIRWFLFELPHLWKEAGRIAGCAVAFGIATYGYLKSMDWLNSLAYIILIGTLMLNEIVTIRWRIDRDRRLEIL